MGRLSHSFSVEYAELYGIECAILINHFQFWIEQNQAMGRNFHDGRTWMYQTQKEISAIYPYWSEDVVCKTIKKLIELKIIIKGNYNKTPFDKTAWYAFENQKMITKPSNDGIDSVEGRNQNPSNDGIRIRQTTEPIPDTKKDTKKDNKQTDVIVPKKITAQKKEKEQKKIIKKPDPLSFENPEKDVCLFSSDSEFKKKKDFINSLDLEDSFVRILEDHTLEDLKIATEAATQWKNKKLKTGEPVHSLGSAILTALKKKWKPAKEKKQIEEEQTKQKQKKESSRKERYLEAKKLESEFATLLPFENTFSVSDSGVFLKIKGSVCPIGLNQEDCVEILKNHIKEYKK